MPKVGDIFVQADLARTMREIVAAEKRGATKGRHEGLMTARDYFYKGAIAKRIGDYMQTHGGLLAAEDLARFHARVGSPVKRIITAMRFTRRASGRRGRRWLKP